MTGLKALYTVDDRSRREKKEVQSKSRSVKKRSRGGRIVFQGFLPSVRKWS